MIKQIKYSYKNKEQICMYQFNLVHLCTLVNSLIRTGVKRNE